MPFPWWQDTPGHNLATPLSPEFCHTHNLLVQSFPPLFCLIPVCFSISLPVLPVSAFLQPWHSVWLAQFPLVAELLLRSASSLVLSRSLPNLSVTMPSQLILHTNLFSSFYLHCISHFPTLVFFPYPDMFSNPVVVSLSSFYRCVIVITYSTSSTNFELLSLRWAISF